MYVILNLSYSSVSHFYINNYYVSFNETLRSIICQLWQLSGKKMVCSLQNSMYSKIVNHESRVISK